jgi:hypothetical protein
MLKTKNAINRACQKQTLPQERVEKRKNFTGLSDSNFIPTNMYNVKRQPRHHKWKKYNGNDIKSF